MRTFPIFSDGGEGGRGGRLEGGGGGAGEQWRGKGGGAQCCHVPQCTRGSVWGIVQSLEGWRLVRGGGPTIQAWVRTEGGGRGGRRGGGEERGGESDKGEKMQY